MSNPVSLLAVVLKALRRIAGTAFVLPAVLLAGLICLGMAEQAEAARANYALLIGINHYASRSEP